MGVLKIRSGGAWVPVAQGVGIASPGLVGYAYGTAAQTGIGNAHIDMTGCSVTFNAIAGHTYRITGYWPRAVQSATVGEHRPAIRTGSNVTWAQNTVTAVAGAALVHYCETIQNAISGTSTVKLSLLTMAGTVDTTAGFLPLIVVQDITTATFDGLATPWTAVTFQNGWANKGGSEQPCQYRKIGDIVYLRGMMTRNPVPFATAAFNLPVGFRPPALVRPTPIVGNSSFTLTLSRADITIQGDYLASAGNADSMWWPIDFQFSTV